jgi:hypothetical protein
MQSQLSRGADINARNERGETFLYRAVNHNWPYDATHFQRMRQTVVALIESTLLFVMLCCYALLIITIVILIIILLMRTEPPTTGTLPRGRRSRSVPGGRPWPSERGWC